MTETQPTINGEIERYLRTGESDPLYAAWSGNFMEHANRAHEDLRGALVRAVRRLAEGLNHAPLSEADTVSVTRPKVAPMVRGLFPPAEQDVVLAAIEQSVVFVTSATSRCSCSIEVSTTVPGRSRTFTSQAWAGSCSGRTRLTWSG